MFKRKQHLFCILFKTKSLPSEAKRKHMRMIVITQVMKTSTLLNRCSNKTVSLMQCQWKWCVESSKHQKMKESANRSLDIKVGRKEMEKVEMMPALVIQLTNMVMNSAHLINTRKIRILLSLLLGLKWQP